MSICKVIPSCKVRDSIDSRITMMKTVNFHSDIKVTKLLCYIHKGIVNHYLIKLNMICILNQVREMPVKLISAKISLE